MALPKRKMLIESDNRLERLCEVVSHNWQRSSSEIKQAVIDDVRQHIGEQKVYDDMTLVVFKQK